MKALVCHEYIPAAQDGDIMFAKPGPTPEYWEGED
jgi:hypothetical protein